MKITFAAILMTFASAEDILCTKASDCETNFEEIYALWEEDEAKSSEPVKS